MTTKAYLAFIGNVIGIQKNERKNRPKSNFFAQKKKGFH